MTYNECRKSWMKKCEFQDTMPFWDYEPYFRTVMESARGAGKPNHLVRAVCKVGNANRTTPVVFAQGCLISAAPDMYGALVEMVNCQCGGCEHGVRDEEHPSKYACKKPSGICCVLRARQALDKANGLFGKEEE